MGTTLYLDYWLINYAQSNVSAKTYEVYAEIVNKYLIPALGNTQILKLTPMHIQGYYTFVLKAGRRDGKGGLSAQTVLHHHRLLRKALQQALKWQLVPRNVADAAEPPRPKHKELQVFDDGEVSRLMEASREWWINLPILVAATTGLRRGEILGLRWKDLDLKAGTLAVRQSLEQTRQGLAFKQPKTKRGCRVVALSGLTVDALRRHRATQAQEKLLMGGGYIDHDLVCAQPDGVPRSPAALTASFTYLIGKLGIEGRRFHDLRHFHATLLLRQGIHPKVVSERLGHATIGITLDTYSHVLPDMQEEAAQKVDLVLRAAIQGA